MSDGEYWAQEAQKARAECDAMRSERDAYKTTLRDEIDENLRLRGLGGARPDEGMTAYIERLIAERDRLRAEVDALRDCRTCRHYTTASGGCMSVLRCIDASAYQRATPIRIWESAASAEAAIKGAA